MMMTCKEISLLASDYVDDEIHGMKRWKIRVHLLACKKCSRFVKQMRVVKDLLNETPTAEEPTEEHVHEIVEEIVGRRTEP
jgi:predicted anti-sigma-YlaC factor YlaD